MKPAIPSYLEAVEECAACQGRAHGDCSDECRYWLATATEAEIEEAIGARCEAKPKARPWAGARAPAEWEYANLDDVR
jgi:hypothetical protein